MRLECACACVKDGGRRFKAVVGRIARLRVVKVVWLKGFGSGCGVW